MRRLSFLLIFFILSDAFTPVKLRKTDYSSCLYNYVPMPMDTIHSIKYKWDHKEIISSVLIDGMESLEKWELSFGKEENVASISLSEEMAFEGKSSIKFVSPTKKQVQLPNGGRHWGRQNLTRKFEEKDFSEYNRISVHIYPCFKGFRKLYLTLVLNNEGNVPDKYNKEGRHTCMLENYQWNKVVMEISHLPRDKVTGIAVSYALQGNEPDAADTIIFYADNLLLESVEPDHSEGWDTNDQISFTHSGYNIDSKKTAFTSLINGSKFKLVNLETQKCLLEKKGVKQSGYAGTFSVFDFSEIKTPGNYKITCGNIESQPFPIDKNVWVPSFEKSINLFFVERCGYHHPGIHLTCHSDWYAVFRGDTVIMNGGWHDAGDMSQSCASTAETAAILFKLSRKLRKTDKKFADRLLEEGLWGLKWLHKNRFDSLKILGWTVLDHYSDGKIGNFDDTPSQPVTVSGGIDNYYAIIANVEAALTLEDINPSLSEKSRQFAINDWKLLAEADHKWNTAELSMAIMAGSRLYDLTHYENIKIQCINYADSLITFQQTEPMNWTIPLNGFFYMNEERSTLFGYNHNVVVASPITGLVELCKLFPGHEKYSKWLRSVRLYANYLKTIARITAPYCMIPANIYKTGTPDDAQVRQGLKMDNDHYLRMFPVWQANRGNTSVILSSGISLAASNQLLKDPELAVIAQSQMEWVVGKNPFCQSLMYGEGYYFSSQYAVFTGDIVGGIPVGIQTRADNDVPYWPPAVLHNYKEIWTHPSNRWLELMEYMDF